MTDMPLRPAVDVGSGRTRRATATDAVTRSRALLLGGPLLVVLYVAAQAVAGSPPAVDDPATTIAAFYDSGAVVASAFLAQAAAIAVGAFAAGLHGVLRRAGDDGPLPLLVVVGGAVAAVGFALTGSATLATVDAARDVGAGSAQTLHALSNGLFMPAVAGLGLLLLGAGASARGTGALPRGLAIAALVLGVVAPLYFGGYATYMLGGLWCGVVGILLARRA